MRRYSVLPCSVVLLLLLLLLALFIPVVSAVRKLQIASPLQALTIWDPEVKQAAAPTTTATTTGTSFRARFLSKFRAGLQAEVDARQQIASASGPPPKATTTATSSSSNTKNKNANALLVASNDWAQHAAARDRQDRLATERRIEEAYDTAVAPFDNRPNTKLPFPNPNRYQFVGVVAASTSSKASPSNVQQQPPITWYARPKPAHAKWSVRLVHVNRAAIIKDLYDRGKVDIFAHYTNATPQTATTAAAATGRTGETATAVPHSPVVASTYTVRERSWKNMWNASLKHVVTDSSGMYWRERRLPPGLYTDGQTVYEASYRYRDGRNGMHKISTFTDFVQSRSISATTKSKIQRRLAMDVPDVVLEE